MVHVHLRWVVTEANPNLFDHLDANARCGREMAKEVRRKVMSDTSVVDAHAPSR